MIKEKGLLIFLIIYIYLFLAIKKKPYINNQLGRYDIISMIISSLSILLAIFMYKNPDGYFIIICGIIIGLINIIFLLIMIKEIITCFTARIDIILNNLYNKLY